jgi:hypothetical protein
MLSTDYNKKIASQVNEINKRYITSNILTNREPTILNYKPQGQDYDAMLRTGNRLIYDPKLEGSGIFSDLLGSIGLGAKNVATTNMRRGLGKKRIHKAKGETNIEGNGIFSDLLGSIGLGKSKKRIHKGKGKYGMFGLGKNDKKDDIIEDIEGGNIEGGMSVATFLSRATESKRDKNLRNIMKDLKDGKFNNPPTVVKSTVGPDYRGGVKKKESNWIKHVKAYAKKHNMKYNEALKEAGKTFKK